MSHVPAPARTPGPARATGWLAALTMVLNGAWLLITQAGWLWLSVVDVVALARALARALLRRLTVLPPTGGAVERLVVVAPCDAAFVAARAAARCCRRGLAAPHPGSGRACWCAWADSNCRHPL